MGLDGSVHVDEAVEYRIDVGRGSHTEPSHRTVRNGWIVIAVASLVFIANIISPPRLMDDVDAVQAQIARNMLASGDWVTARLNGIAYLEKAPLVYWMMATSYRVFGIHDWAARLPLAIAVVALCWVTYRFGRWAFGEDAGLYAGLVLATSTGLFLFTRILIPDATLTLAITGAIWIWVRQLERDEEPSLKWSALLGVCLGTGLLLKGLIAVVFPLIAGVAYIAVSGQFFSKESWCRLHLGIAAVVALVVAAPWHVLATLRNPPFFALTLHSGPGQYRGFFWFYFINEHLLRFLNLRYPRDYNTVPRFWFWLLNLVWVFPWSVYFLASLKLSYRTTSRAGRVGLMALCWIGTVLLFFTFSTTQEYYSMPIYPALALLVGLAIASGGGWVRAGTGILLALFTLLFVSISVVLLCVWTLPAHGNIANALTQHPDLYTLSLGHIRDLTLIAFAYLKLPLGLAAFAFGLGTVTLLAWRAEFRKSVLVIAVSMILFFQAARIALIRFESYLGSYPLAESLQHSPPGQLIEADAYYAFSSVFFYTGRTALLLNGRINNLEYGSYAPGAPDVFIDDTKFVSLWTQADRYYLLAYGTDVPHLEQLVGRSNLHVVAEDSGNYLMSNHALP
jgi:4-amino-4-deoxy-L-arabinose transferase-like glycosyltransferase